MKAYFLPLALFAAFLIFGSGCVSPQKAPNSGADRLSIASVQRSIRIGMSSTEVVEILGAPNMVTTDENRNETWVYDRMCTNIQGSASEGYFTLILAGVGTSRYNRQTSQRSLTIIVMFDEKGKVRDFRYRQTSF